MQDYYSEPEMKPYLYGHGLPFSEILAENVDDLMDRIRRKKASLLIVDGGVGEGKTTQAVHLGDYVNIKYGDGKPIDFSGPQMAMGGEAFGKKLLECHERGLPCIIYDEAGDFDKKTTLSKFNRNLMRVFEMYRGFKILVILCLPRFYKLENELFDLGIPRLLLHCEDRTERSGNFRAFDLEQMYYIKHQATKIIVKPKCYDFGMANFRGHFLDLPPARSRELDRVSVDSKRAETRKTVSNVKDRISTSQIMARLGKGRSWVQAKLKTLRIVDRVRYNNEYWYPKNTLLELDRMVKNHRRVK